MCLVILLHLDYYILLRCDISPCKVTILHVYSLTERIWLNWFMNGIELMFQELVPCDWHLPSDVPSPCFDWREPPLKVVDWWSFNHCSRVGDRRKRGDCAKVQSSRHLRILLSQCGITDCQCPNHHSITLWLTCWV